MTKEEIRAKRAAKVGGRRGHGGPPGMGGGGHAKDFTGTWKKLLNYIKNYHTVVIIALICACLGTVLTLLGPDKLSDMTNTITAGIKPNTKILTQITETMSGNLQSNAEKLVSEMTAPLSGGKLTQITAAMSDNVSANMEALMGGITASFSDPAAMQEKMGDVMQSQDIAMEDKMAFQQMMTSGMDMDALAQLPESILEALLEEVTLNGEIISVNEQILVLQRVGRMNAGDPEALNALPESVQNALYTEITVDGTTLSGADQLSLLEVLSGPDPEAGEAELLTALPDSILSLLFTDLEINGAAISTADQLTALRLMSSLESAEEMDAHGLREMMDRLPDSVLDAMFTDIAVEGVTITGADQRCLMELFRGLDMENMEATEEALTLFDEMPDSVYSLVEPGIDMDRVFRIAITLVCFYGMSFVLSAAQSWIMSTITQRTSRRLRRDISRKINKLPIWYYNRTTTGDVLSRVTNDVDTIGQSLNQSLGTLVSAIVLLLGSLFMMIKTNLIMTATAVIASLLGFFTMFFIMGKSQKYFIAQQKHLGAINGFIEEIYSGHTVVKAYNGEKEASEEFNDMNAKLRDAGFKAQMMGGLMQPLMGFVGNFGYVAVCVVGGALALNGQIEFGVIVAFMMYVRYFTNPLTQMAQAFQSLQSAAAAGERVFEFLEAEEMEDESSKMHRAEKAQGYVEFKNVKFGYEDSDRTIIHDFSASAKPGQKIAIVGPTGAGKTTMVNLLMRFHEIQSGEICIDGVSTKEIPREDVRSQFCMVLQDTWLFEGTIRENLVYSTKNVSDEQIRRACKAVGLDHFIRTLPKGYDTVLNDQVNLSQGQKQQLTIARAMIADRPMLILDEATSSVDTRTELKIQEAMDKLMENRTSFVIAHRLSTIKNADLILVMRDGDIVESGTHEALLKKGGFYAELYNSQFEDAS